MNIAVWFQTRRPTWRYIPEDGLLHEYCCLLPSKMTHMTLHPRRRHSSWILLSASKQEDPHDATSQKTAFFMNIAVCFQARLFSLSHFNKLCEKLSSSPFKALLSSWKEVSR
jgi:hypothetical protein